MTLQDRRSFLATLGGSAFLLAACRRNAIAGLAGPGASRRRLSRIGIQLYTVRQRARTDLSATLADIARIGYKEVEFWGTFPQKPPEIRRMLDQNGLTSPSVHVGFPNTPAAFATIFADASVMGQEWITVPSLPSGPRATVGDWKRIAAQFNDAGARAKAAGFRFAFHNHNEEFTKIGDVVPLEVLIRETDPSLVSFELDIHWAYDGGADPVDLIRRFPTRFTMVHVKDSSGPPKFTQTDVGAGAYQWAKIFDTTWRAGVQHYFAESDDATDPMAFAKASYDYLSHLEF